ncbi:hypothetical protein AZO1586I_1675 [Bathymodiolus thermophilus thioautotrophic gill symbiont]|jgi:hypothetical protein|uniref:Uncharacterized protein n=3 Tax=sulfur-oxidizing symbionts TaxID=32036 RepID=A0ACA8ZNG9_9GAMM|nr:MULTISPECIES: hypothetical protein [sulfur-oxidizing symbionts]CAC9501806.1 hypothetical protein [uncultured Gammaproteobacteria bacterium]CAB5494947.1 hypothetical protein AZO1586R_150 [Bathymodiolus azoricus thioautotrophic gill symbiont]CAB5506738.1 hypothetical protein AZO1586I_1675 [Bathymodiolus thermophilus thioautotrophic gill symbiont]CAC9520929.1 hypothetical protein [uncultured Gammaproteobacteria bacterium]CAC9521464.1 hypothetical protein [uncultured Gammaproteobacteria bacteri
MPIKINDVEISDDDVFQEMQYQTDASNIEEVIFKAAQALVVQQLLLQEAGIKKNDANEEEKINQLINDNVIIPIANIESCQRYYDNNKVKFLDKERNEILSFAMVEEHIREYLQNQSSTSGIKEYINVLAADADIKGFDFKDPSAMNIKIQ